MPAQNATMGLAKRLGAEGAKAFNEVKGNETRAGMGDLPAGIKNGVAKLVQMHFDQNDEGKDFFYAAGVIVAPKSVKPKEWVDNGDGTYTQVTSDIAVNIEGLRTSIYEPLEGKRGKRETLAEHFDWILNQLRLSFGVDTKGTTVDNIEQVCAALVKKGPYFSFSTQSPKPTDEYPEPMIFENWGKPAEVGSASDSGTSSNEPNTVVENEGEADTSKYESMTLLEVGELVDSTQDADAGNYLMAAATEAGMSEDEANNIEPWRGLALHILGIKADEEDEEAQGIISAAAEEAEVEDTFDYYVEWADAINAAAK